MNKKLSALLLASAMLAGCASSGTAATAATADTAATAAASADAAATSTKAAPADSGSKNIDDLKIEFVPSKDADVIITGTKGLDQLIINAMKDEGYTIGKVDITVGTNYDATGEALSAGSIDLGWLPGGTYALYSDETDVILTATRNGLSNDSTDPKTWNGDANATQKNGPQVTYYRSPDLCNAV
jgi:phosphonate transport system substrate-binding protein